MEKMLDQSTHLERKCKAEGLFLGELVVDDEVLKIKTTAIEANYELRRLRLENLKLKTALLPFAVGAALNRQLDDESLANDAVVCIEICAGKLRNARDTLIECW